MFANALLLLFVTAQSSADTGIISGVAVNGTAGGAPLAGAEIVLRASRDGAFVPIAETTTDAAGHFMIDGLPTGHDTIYLAGVNRASVHYPGPRVRLEAAQPSAHIKLVAYDAVQSPSPLLCERHEIGIKPGTGFIEISESLVIANPSLTAYVGQATDDMAPITLTLSLPKGFDKVTFDKEFHGRNYQVHDSQLITQLPWPPGRRELHFTYRLPVEQQRALYQRTLDLPTDEVFLRVLTANPKTVACNLPNKSALEKAEANFAHHGSRLAAGHVVELRIGSTPIGFEAYGRWIAVAVLLFCVAGSVPFLRTRVFHSTAKTTGSERNRQPASTKGQRSRRTSTTIHASRPSR